MCPKIVHSGVITGEIMRLLREEIPNLEIEETPEIFLEPQPAFDSSVLEVAKRELNKPYFRQNERW
jgi:hypothetical protein